MLKIALSAFALVFLAELGDKTQLAVLALAAESRTPWAVLIGAGSALVLATALAVGLACLLHKMVPAGFAKGLHYSAGALFILVGLWAIFRA